MGLLALLILGTSSAEWHKVEIAPSWVTPAGEEVRWTIPMGAVRFGEDGSVGLVKVRKNVNVALELEKFGGKVRAESNQKDAGKVVDGRCSTWWSPDPRDPVEKWRIEVDLGKAILTRKIRFIFADTTAGGDTLRPFERFRVYISNGTGASKDVPEYRLLAKTEGINRERVLEYTVTYEEAGDTTEAGETMKKVLNLDLVRFVRVIVEAPNISGRPALAEIEVLAVGDNIAFLTDRNGGKIKAYVNEADASNIYDGHAGTRWQFYPVMDVEWAKHPSVPGLASCFEWDLGLTYWVDQIYLDFGRQSSRYAGVNLEASRNILTGYILKVSDGSPRPGGPLDWPPGNKYDYKLLADVENRSMPYQMHYIHEFEPMKIRQIFFRTAHGFATWGRCGAHLFEMQIFGEGYPAEVVMESGPVGLSWMAGGEGEKLISRLRLEAEQPLYPETRVEVQTRTGNSVDTVWTYYKKIGKKLKEVTEEEYLKLSERFRYKEPRGIRPGKGWSKWSLLYPEEGVFLSPSPSRYVQFRVKLVTDRPDTAPSFKGLWVDIVEPLIRKCTGSVEPRVVEEVDTLWYTYRIWPEAGPEDKGFDRVLIIAPVVEDTVKVGGRPDSCSVAFGRDSLLVELPRAIKDSVEVDFKARVSENGLIFAAFIGLPDDKSGEVIWQQVYPCEPGATSVFLPILAERKELIWNVEVTPVLIPNKEAVISFSLLKVEGKEPWVEIYDLRGNLVRRLEEKDGKYTWDGRDGSGSLVPPGVYLCTIGVDSDSGRSVVCRTITVVY